MIFKQMHSTMCSTMCKRVSHQPLAALTVVIIASIISIFLCGMHSQKEYLSMYISLVTCWFFTLSLNYSNLFCCNVLLCDTVIYSIQYNAALIYSLERRRSFIFCILKSTLHEKQQKGFNSVACSPVQVSHYVVTLFIISYYSNTTWICIIILTGG